KFRGVYARWNRSLVSSSSSEPLPGLVGFSWEILYSPLTYSRMNSSVRARAPPDAGVYCPVLLSVACSWPVTSTTGLAPGSDSRPGGSLTRGSLVRIVTAAPGCQARLAAPVRYCLATWKSLAPMALATRKFFTTSSGLQPGCGPRTSSPQEAPAAGGGAGGEAPGGPVRGGMPEPPPAGAAAVTSRVTRAVQPGGRRAAAGRGSGIAPPPLVAVVGRVGHRAPPA